AAAIKVANRRSRLTVMALSSMACPPFSQPSAEDGNFIALYAYAALIPKILCLQLDRRAVRRALGCVLPGIAIARQRGAVGHALRGNDALERVEPVPIV